MHDDITNTTYYYLTDRRFSVVGLIDPAGNLQEAYDYSAFGLATAYQLDALQNLTAVSLNASTLSGNPYGYTGRRYDTETQLWYYRNRMYSASLGRFLQRDPARFVDGYNIYAYVQNRPVIFFDPMGLGTIDIINKKYPNASQAVSVRVVMRQFSGSKLSEYIKSQREFTTGIAGVKVGHAFLQWFDRNNNVVMTASYHPNPWPQTYSSAVWYEVDKKVTTLVDGNNARPGRVWFADSKDMTLMQKIVNINTEKLLASSSFLVVNNSDEAQSLLNYVVGWTDVNKVGIEIGRSILAKNEPIKESVFGTPEIEYNTHGKEYSKSGDGIVQYNLYGRNCVWFATCMMHDTGNLTKGIVQNLSPFNDGVGLTKWFANNHIIESYLRAKADDARSGLYEKVMSLLGGLIDGFSGRSMASELKVKLPERPQNYTIPNEEIWKVNTTNSKENREPTSLNTNSKTSDILGGGQSASFIVPYFYQ